jgi:hypothetical protein
MSCLAPIYLHPLYTRTTIFPPKHCEIAAILAESDQCPVHRMRKSSVCTPEFHGFIRLHHPA